MAQLTQPKTNRAQLLTPDTGKLSFAFDENEIPIYIDDQGIVHEFSEKKIILAQNYKDILPQGNAAFKEAGDPASITPIDTLYDPMPTSEFEDCSQIYNPDIVIVGDYFFLYYNGNTQKFKTLITDPSSTQTLSDFGRIDRVFLAYRRVNEGIHGVWQKWEDGRKPVLDIGTFDNATLDGGNVWKSNVINDGNQLIMSYTGDSQRSNTAHNFNPAIATSTDGINWIKKGFISGMTAGTYRGYIINFQNDYYLFTYTANYIQLYHTITPFDMNSWVLVNSDITASLGTHYNRIWNAQIFGNTVYLTVTIPAVQDKVVLLSVDISDILNTEVYVDNGNMLIGSTLFGESYNGTSESPATLNYNYIFKESDNLWTIFYSYYKNRMARYPYVPECGIRSISIENLIPKII